MNHTKWLFDNYLPACLLVCLSACLPTLHPCVRMHPPTNPSIHLSVRCPSVNFHTYPIFVLYVSSVIFCMYKHISFHISVSVACKSFFFSMSKSGWMGAQVRGRCKFWLHLWACCMLSDDTTESAPFGDLLAVQVYWNGLFLLVMYVWLWTQFCLLLWVLVCMSPSLSFYFHFHMPLPFPSTLIQTPSLVLCS